MIMTRESWSYCAIAMHYKHKIFLKLCMDVRDEKTSNLIEIGHHCQNTSIKGHLQRRSIQGT